MPGRSRLTHNWQLALEMIRDKIEPHVVKLSGSREPEATYRELFYETLAQVEQLAGEEYPLVDFETYRSIIKPALERLRAAADRAADRDTLLWADSAIRLTAGMARSGNFEEVVEYIESALPHLQRSAAAALAGALQELHQAAVEFREAVENQGALRP